MLRGRITEFISKSTTINIGASKKRFKTNKLRGMKIFSCQNRCKLKPIRNKQAEEIRKSPLAKIGAPPLRLQTIDHLIIKVGPTETEAVKMFENLKTSIPTI